MMASIKNNISFVLHPNKIEFINGDIETIKIDFDSFFLILGLGISQYLNQDIIKKILPISGIIFPPELGLLLLVHNFHHVWPRFQKLENYC